MFEIIKTDGNDNGRIWKLGENPLIFGRGTPEFMPDIDIDDPKVSRRHLRVYMEKNKLYAENISANEVLINGVPLLKERELFNKDCIQVFSHKYTIRLTKAKSRTNKLRNLSLAIAAGLAIAVAVMYFTSDISNKSKIEKVTHNNHRENGTNDVTKLYNRVKFAERLYEERNSELGGRYTAFRAYKKILSASMPDSLRSSCELKIKALNQEMDSIYQQYWTMGDIAYRQKNMELCRRYFELMTTIIPDPLDKRFQKAKDVLYNLNLKENNG